MPYFSEFRGPIGLIALAGAASLVGCTPADPPDGSQAAAQASPVISTDRSCFFTRNVNGYSEAPDGPRGEDRLYVHTGASDRHVLETFGPCPDLDWSFRIGIDTRMQTSLCTGEIATVVVPSTIGSSGVDRCTARVIGKLVES